MSLQPSPLYPPTHEPSTASFGPALRASSSLLFFSFFLLRAVASLPPFRFSFHPFLQSLRLLLLFFSFFILCRFFPLFFIGLPFAAFLLPLPSYFRFFPSASQQKPPLIPPFPVGLSVSLHCCSFS